MKTVAIIAATIALATSASALEHVTLTGNTPSKAVAPGSIVEVVGTNKNNDGTADNLKLTFADGAITRMVLRGKESGQFSDMKGNIFTGLTSVALEQSNGTPAPNTSVTLKITPASEIGATPPGAVLVLPENSTGDYEVIIQSSDDLVSWTNVISHHVNATSAPNFFRARIVKTTP
jgi:hypothetical protein